MPNNRNILNKGREELARHLLHRVTAEDNGTLTVLLSAFDSVPFKEGRLMRREVALKNARVALMFPSKPSDEEIAALSSAPATQPIVIDRKTVEKLADTTYEQLRLYASNVPRSGPRIGGASPYSSR